MKRPTRKQVYDVSVLVMRGVNAITIWAIFAVVIYGFLTRP